MIPTSHSPHTQYQIGPFALSVQAAPRPHHLIGSGQLEAGELEQAARFLGHPHILSGAVVHGNEIGRTLGSPTANLPVPQGVIAPGFGVYATRVHLPDGTHPAVTNVGVRPTVSSQGRAVIVEPWILDFQGDLYGQTICLELHKQLRPERKFSGVDQLRAAILENAAQTRSYFAAKGPVQ